MVSYGSSGINPEECRFPTQVSKEDKEMWTVDGSYRGYQQNGPDVKAAKTSEGVPQIDA